MTNSPFLTTVARPRDPKLLWPMAAIASVLAHGIGLGLVRTLAIQTPALPEGEMAPLPVQLVRLPPNPSTPEPATDAAATGSAEAGSPAEPVAASAPVPIAGQTTPVVAAPPPAAVTTPLQPTAPPIAPQPQPPPPSVDSPPVRPAPPISPDPLPSVAPAPPRPTPPDASAAEVDGPPVGSSGEGTSVAGGGMAASGGQVVPVGIRLNPSGRDIPETAPQLLGTTAIEVRPLASGCGFANLDALLTGITAASVQMQIRVEPSGDISDVTLLQSTGSSAVDDLVGCVVQQRLKLQPATSAGVPQLTDAFILDARLQF